MDRDFSQCTRTVNMLKKKITTGVAGLLFAVSAAFALPVQQAEAATPIVVCIKDICLVLVVQ